MTNTLTTRQMQQIEQRARQMRADTLSAGLAWIGTSLSGLVHRAPSRRPRTHA